MSKPLLIYLDSSDWSNLAAAASEGDLRDREKWLDVRTRLLSARDSGRAEFRFSQTIVAEAYPLSVTHEAHGLARARAITELCGKRCLVESNTLARWEIRWLAAGTSHPFDRALALRDDAAWHSDPDEVGGRMGSSLMADPRTVIRDALKDQLPGVGKKRRRQFESRVFDSDGKLPSWARQGMLSPDVLAEAAANMGLPADTPGIETIGRVLAGEVPPEAADQWLLSILRDLPLMFSLVQTRQQADQLFGYLRRAGGDLAKPMAETARDIERFVSTYGLQEARSLQQERPFLDVRQLREKVRATVLKALWATERKRRGPEKRIRGEVWANRVENSPFGSIPSLDSFLAAGAALVAKATNMSAQPYRGRESDAGDITHMSYLPYVDVFRCDRGNAAVAKSLSRNTFDMSQ